MMWGYGAELHSITCCRGSLGESELNFFSSAGLPQAITASMACVRLNGSGPR